MSLQVILDALISGILIGAVYGMVAIGLTIIFGILKIINFAHGEFMMLGMFLTYFSTIYLGISPYLSILIVIPLMFFIGVLCQIYLIRPILEAPEFVQFLLTFALLLVMQNLALLMWTGDWRSLSIPLAFKIITIGNINLQLTMLVAFIGALLITFILIVFLKITDYGKAIRACSEEREGALFVGLNVNRLFYISFGIGTTMAAVAGALILPFFPVSPMVGLSFTIQSFVIVVLGGLGSIQGALIGGLIVGVAESMSALFLPTSLKQLVTYGLFIVIVCFKPSGIFGVKERI
jgi:branched-chain amino acid transport system permease protein